MNDISNVHKVLLNFEKRAENKPDEIISTTFVDAEPLLTILQSPRSQVIFGRRGTGKTHALKYCLNSTKNDGELSVYLDVRSIGSNGSFYGDQDVPQVERGLRLVNDILHSLVDELYPFAIQRIDEGYNAQQITIRLDDLSEAIGRVKISGSIERTEIANSEDSHSSTIAARISGDALGFGGVITGGFDSSLSSGTEVIDKRSGLEIRHIDFAQTQIALRGLLEVLNVDRMWLFLDEWSETPRAIQPYLADLIRKTIIPLGKIIVKIAAIEQRSAFVQHTSDGDYIGLELGADISADLNLDEFLVFDYDERKSISFFKELIFKNYLALSDGKNTASTADELANILFTEKRAVEEFTRAVEGVPRDALNLVSRVVTKAFGRKAGVDDIRKAALDWYTQDKANVVNSSTQLNRSLNHIIDEVIQNRRARAFLFQAGSRHAIIDKLYDARVLHLLKKNISSRDEPGKRYDAWKIDYGCYVDLIRTQRAPLGLLPSGDDEFIDVPTDDYRSIRRAVLTMEDLDRFLESNI